MTDDECYITAIEVSSIYSIDCMANQTLKKKPGYIKKVAKSMVELFV